MEEPLLEEGANHEHDDDVDAMTPSTAATTTLNHIPRRQSLLLQAIFGLLGVGILVPWNAFINAKPYFARRFCEHYGDEIDPHLESNFALCYNLSAITWLGGILFWQFVKDQRVQTSETNQRSHHDNSSHAVWLVLLPLSIYVAVFFGQSIGTTLVKQVSPQTFQALTLISMALCGMCGATATAGILATAGLFPSHISTAPFLAGQSVGGVAVSLANFVAAAWEDQEVYWETFCQSGNTTIATEEPASIPDTCVPYTQFDGAVFGYFLAGSLVLLASLLGYIYIDHFQRGRHRNEYETVYEAHDTLVNNNRHQPDESLTVDQSPRVGVELSAACATETKTEVLSMERATALHHRHSSPPTRSTSNVEGYSRRDAGTEDAIAAFHDEPVPTEMDNNEISRENDAVSSHNETAQVWQKVREPAICIYLVFVVTLALFPGWISELRSVRQCSSHHRLYNDLYSPAAFVLFNACDLLGRILAGRILITGVRHVPRRLVQGAVLRFLCFPLLGLCVGGSADSHRIEIPSDLYSFVLQVLFGTSNGFLVTMAFVYAPTVLPSTTHVQERSAELLNFSLSLGLLSGTFLSFPVSQVLR